MFAGEFEFQYGLGKLGLKLTHYSQVALYSMVSAILTIIVSGDSLLPIWRQAITIQILSCYQLYHQRHISV